jgi:prophage antirepressor-like protein
MEESERVKTLKYEGYNIRVLNIKVFPMYYAVDIAEVLKITNIRNSISAFSEDEIVSCSLKEKYNVTLLRSNGNIDNNMVLLTDLGAIRLIICSNSDVKAKFYKWMFNEVISNYLYNKTSEYNESKNKIIDKLEDKIEVLETKLEKIKNVVNG